MRFAPIIANSAVFTPKFKYVLGGMYAWEHVGIF